MPPAVGASAQDVMNPSSPLATGVATPQPSVGAEVELKVEVKRESQLDAQFEDGGQGMSAATCTSTAATGNRPVVLPGCGCL